MASLLGLEDVLGALWGPPTTDGGLCEDGGWAFMSIILGG